MPIATYAQIKQEIAAKVDVLDQIRQARLQMRGRARTAASLQWPKSLLAAVGPVPESRTFCMVAQGDSWFDYPVGTDIIYCLQNYFGHIIENIAVYGSTLNDEAYGPVPKALFSTCQYSDVSRIAELVHLLQRERPCALLISAGGNDITNDKLFTILNNANSALPHVNAAVLDAVVNATFRGALEYIVSMALAVAGDPSSPPWDMTIFLHGYDYPWPDGRSVVHFLGVDIGPWLDPPLTAKNYPLSDMPTRRAILKQFIDSLNTMQKDVAAQHAGKVVHVDLTGTLTTQQDWANELHPTDHGFANLAMKFNAALQAAIP